MLSIRDFFIYLFIMAGVTYLIRALPLVIFKGKITNRFVQSFLYYVPYAVLGAMTFPSILFSTGNLAASIAGLITACVLNVGAGVLDSPPAKDVAYVLYCYLDIL